MLIVWNIIGLCTWLIVFLLCDIVAVLLKLLPVRFFRFLAAVSGLGAIMTLWREAAGCSVNYYGKHRYF